MNIDIEILQKLLKSKDYWLEEVEYLQEDYKLLANKILAYYMNKNTMPSITFVKKNINKFTEDIKQRKNLISILETIEEKETDEDISRDELLELLVDRYKTTELLKVNEKLLTCVKNKDFNTIKEYTVAIDRIIELGNVNSTYEDSKDYFEREDSSVLFQKTGIFDNEEISKIPLGSLALIVARSKMGKTALLIKSLTENYLSGKDVEVISYEIPRQAIKNRMLSYISEVPISEINEGVYSLADSKDRVIVAKYAISRDISFKDAKMLYLKKGLEGLQALPFRKNRLIIRASYSREDIIEMKEQGIKPKPLPNDREILTELRLMNKVKPLDYLYIDYVSLIPFITSRESRETNIATFTREFKHALSETGTVGFLLNQGKSKSEPYITKYSEAPILDADMVVAITPTKEMLKNGYSAISVTHHRHGEGWKTYPVEKKLEIQNFVRVDTEIMDFDDIEEIIRKENKEPKK